MRLVGHMFAGNTKTLLISASTALLCVVGANTSQAAGAGWGHVQDTPRQSSAGIDFAFFTRSEDNSSVTLVTPRLSTQVMLGQSFALALDWSFVYLTASGVTDSDSRFQVSNPFLGAYYVDDTSELHFRAGGGVVLPLANTPDDRGNIASVTYFASALAHGLKDIWTWTPETAALLLSADVERDFGPVYAGAEMELASIIGVGDNSDDDSELVLQLTPRVGADLGAATVGLRLPIVWLATTNGDNAQLIAEPYVEVPFGSLVARASFSVYLDEPTGFSFDSNRTWLLSAGLGGKW